MLHDPRVARGRLHLLLNVVVIALLGVIYGVEGWDELEVFGESKESWLNAFLDLTHGTPSADTFRRVFEALRASELATRMQSFVRELAGPFGGRLSRWTESRFGMHWRADSAERRFMRSTRGPVSSVWCSESRWSRALGRNVRPSNACCPRSIFEMQLPPSTCSCAKTSVRSVTNTGQRTSPCCVGSRSCSSSATRRSNEV